MSDYLARIAPRPEKPDRLDDRILALHREWMETDEDALKTEVDRLLNHLPDEEREDLRAQLHCRLLGCDMNETGWTVRWNAQGVFIVATCQHCGREIIRAKATDRDIETAPLDRETIWLPEALETGDVESLWSDENGVPPWKQRRGDKLRATKPKSSSRSPRR